MIRRIFFFLIFLDHVYEVMLYVRDSSKYDRPDICIDNPLVIQEILKKSGMRWRTEGAPHKQSSEKTFVDAVRRLIFFHFK